MARRCTICTHPYIEAINTALVQGASTLDLAKEYGVSDDALQRHRATHLPESLAKAQDAKEVAHGDDLIDELRRCVERVNLLSDACDEWLRDPENSERYFIGPRSEDIKVVYEEQSGERTVRKKAPLSELLARVVVTSSDKRATSTSS